MREDICLACFLSLIIPASSLRFPDPARVVGARLDHERMRKLALHLRNMGDEEDPGEAGLQRAEGGEKVAAPLLAYLR